MIERRTSSRRRTLLSGRISVKGLGAWSDCTVRNMSGGGASITFPGHENVPRSFDINISGRPAERARVIWCRNGHAGLALDANQECAAMELAARTL